MDHLVPLLIGIALGAISVGAIFGSLYGRLRSARAEVEAERAYNARTKDTLLEQERLVGARETELQHQRADLENRAISYADLQGENAILKRDLQNVDVSLRKRSLDFEEQKQQQDALAERCRDLGTRYLKDNVKWISASLTANNFIASKQRLLNVIERTRGIGIEVPAEEESNLLADLKAEFERAVQIALAREEQARIKAQIREQQRLERDVEREVRQLDRERAAIQAALDRELATARDQHSQEIEHLRARLAEAEAKAQRATSMAQLTKAGHVYVISNIGSFGDSVFKVGMTRRLEPQDRVRELGDASVPFPFDVHMMISSEDAPKLENTLHRELHKLRINKVNPRKEFFKVDLETIREIVERNHGEVQYVADPEALEYHQSLTMSESDSQYIEAVYEELEEETGDTVVVE